METTTNQPMTEAEAVKSILQLQDTPENQGENEQPQVEANDATVEPQTETNVADEVDLEASDADDDLLLELDADENEVLENEEIEAPEELHQVKVNGEIKEVTYEELTRDYSGQAYIQKGMQEVAQLRKELEAEKNAFHTERDQFAQTRQQQLEFLTQNQQAGIVQPTPPDESIFETDPMGYMRQKMDYDKELGEYQQKIATLYKMEQERQAEADQRLQNYTAEQTRILHEKLPAMADPAKSEGLKAKLLKHGEHYGFTAQELSMVRDHRYVLTLNDAAKYRELVEKRKQATSGNKTSQTPTVKSGAKKRPGSLKAKAKEEQRKKFLRTGSAADAVSLLFE